ncbi:MAG: T9SS type A sorting domain-containing protein, partial [Ignavibacteriae bacterium]|nr:T9SS type A sorting domain-containing protein [Ignavibacteriota bacterium]
TVTNGLTDIGFMVRVTRTSGNVWTLYTSTLPTASGSGAVATAQPSAANTPINQGSATNSTYTTFTNGYFGFAAVHSSGADARAGAEFDQLYFDTNSSSPLAKSELAIPIRESVEQLPQSFHLYQNYPNPFNPTTTIRYTIPSDAFVTLIVHDVLGQEVKRLVNGTVQAGIHDVMLDGTNLSSGVYYYKMQASSLNGNSEPVIETRRLVLMK